MLSVVRVWLLGAAAVLALAGCGSSGPSLPPDTTEPSATTAPAEHGSYAHCLAEHGIATPPAGPGTPPGVDDDTWRVAQEACATLAPGPASTATPSA